MIRKFNKLLSVSIMVASITMATIACNPSGNLDNFYTVKSVNFPGNYTINSMVSINNQYRNQTYIGTQYGGIYTLQTSKAGDDKTVEIYQKNNFKNAIINKLINDSSRNGDQITKNGNLWLFGQKKDRTGVKKPFINIVPNSSPNQGTSQQGQLYNTKIKPTAGDQNWYNQDYKISDFGQDSDRGVYAFISFEKTANNYTNLFIRLQAGAIVGDKIEVTQTVYPLRVADISKPESNVIDFTNTKLSNVTIIYKQGELWSNWNIDNGKNYFSVNWLKSQHQPSTNWTLLSQSEENLNTVYFDSSLAGGTIYFGNNSGLSWTPLKTNEEPSSFLNPTASVDQDNNLKFNFKILQLDNLDPANMDLGLVISQQHGLFTTQKWIKRTGPNIDPWKYVQFSDFPLGWNVNFSYMTPNYDVFVGTKKDDLYIIKQGITIVIKITTQTSISEVKYVSELNSNTFFVASKNNRIYSVTNV